jgi:DNA replication and repair protein RecF
VHLEWLELQDYRSYAAANVRFGPGVHVLVGPNAQGKTNLVEAIHYLAVGSSHRASGDAQLVRAGAA